MAALGYAYTLLKQTSRSPERCTNRNATSAEFLEVKIPPRVLEGWRKHRQACNKMAALGYVYTLGKQTSRSPERCTAQNATGARFLEVQIRPRVLVYDWDPLVPCDKR